MATQKGKPAPPDVQSTTLSDAEIRSFWLMWNADEGQVRGSVVKKLAKRPEPDAAGRKARAFMELELRTRYEVGNGRQLGVTGGPVAAPRENPAQGRGRDIVEKSYNDDVVLAVLQKERDERLASKSTKSKSTDADAAAQPVVIQGKRFKVSPALIAALRASGVTL